MNLIQRGTTASRANRGKSVKKSIAQRNCRCSYLGKSDDESDSPKNSGSYTLKEGMHASKFPDSCLQEYSVPHQTINGGNQTLLLLAWPRPWPGYLRGGFAPRAHELFQRKPSANPGIGPKGADAA